MERLIAEEDCEHLAMVFALLAAHLPHCAGVMVNVDGWWRCSAWGCAVPLVPAGKP